MYWIATLLWFRGIYISNWPLPHRGTQLMLSLFFIPDYFFPGQGRMYPLLPHGWTLNYEMAFYLLFALALFLPRRFGIALLILLPELLVALGLIYHLPTGETPAAIPGFYLDPIILLLSRGVLIGLVLLELKKFPTIRIPFSPALLLFIPTILMLAFPRTIGAAPLWGPLISYSTVIVLLCLATNQDHLGWVNRTLVLLGDASYSTYLFHLSVYPFLISWVLRGYGRMHATMQSPALFLVLSVVAANILGLGIHLVVERPIIKALRLIRFGPPRVSAESASVGA
jgi:exopolysaccharide production protein ExoZ